jgi:hypothetical protein
MGSAVVSGLFAVIGTALGWRLSEAGAGLRSRAERRRAEQAEATARVFDAARAAASIAEGMRFLVQIDDAKKKIGEGFGTEEYTVKSVEIAELVQQPHLIALAITAKGPRLANPRLMLWCEKPKSSGMTPSRPLGRSSRRTQTPGTAIATRSPSWPRSLFASPRRQVRDLYCATTTNHELRG